MISVTVVGIERGADFRCNEATQYGDFVKGKFDLGGDKVVCLISGSRKLVRFVFETSDFKYDNGPWTSKVHTSCMIRLSHGSWSWNAFKDHCLARGVNIKNMATLEQHLRHSKLTTANAGPKRKFLPGTKRAASNGARAAA